MANSQMVLPHETLSYGETKDEETDQVPMCTLKSFPYMIEHCIEWGKDRF